MPVKYSGPVVTVITSVYNSFIKKEREKEKERERKRERENHIDLANQKESKKYKLTLGPEWGRTRNILQTLLIYLIYWLPQ